MEDTIPWWQQSQLLFVAHVIKVHLVLLALKENPVVTVTTEPLENPEKMEKTPRSCRPTKSSLVSSAHLDLQDQLALLDQKDHLDQKAALASLHAMAFPAIKACKVNLAQSADPDAKAHEVLPATLDVKFPFPDLKGLLAHPDNLASLDPKDNPAPMDNPSKAHLANPETQAHPAEKDALDLLANLVLPATMARKALAITAPNPEPHQAIRLAVALDHSSSRTATLTNEPIDSSGKYANGYVYVALLLCFHFADQKP